MFVNLFRKNHLMVVFGLLLIFDLVRPAKMKNVLDLIILHSNDMHARFLPIDSSLESYRYNDPNIEQGYGGFARISQAIKDHRRSALRKKKFVLYLNAGDNFMGSPWFNFFESNVTADFMNVLKPEAMCLGNHEFDHGLPVLEPFLDKVKFPVLFANFKDGDDHPLRKKKKIMPSTILEVDGYKIGVIGYLTPETKAGVAEGYCNVHFTPEISAVNEEAEKLKAKGIMTIIALGHSGFPKDLEIAEKCPLIDILIGGHTHTYMQDGSDPLDNQPIESAYPTVVTQSSGKKVLVVQAFCFTKYLGKLELRIHKITGRIMKYGGNPILMHPTLPKDPEIVALEKKYGAMEAKIAGPTLATSELDFSDFRCRTAECGIGNMITDSFVKAAAKAKLNNTFKSSVALFTSGAIRSGIVKGPLTKPDLSLILQFPSELVIVKITGKKLWKALEHSVRRYCEQRFIGSFLQMSGLAVVFDAAKKPHKRVVSVHIRNSQSEFEKLDLQKEYNVIITKFLFGGGDEFTMFEKKNEHEYHFLSITILDAFEKYIKKLKVINPKPVHEGRITVLNEPPLKPDIPPLHSYN